MFVPCCDIHYVFRIKTMFGSSLYFQLFVGGFMSYLRYLCLFAYSGVQHILCYVFIRIVYTMLPVSLDCPLLIAPSVFSNVYWYMHFINVTGLNTDLLDHTATLREMIRASNLNTCMGFKYILKHITSIDNACEFWLNCRIRIVSH